MSLKTLNVLHWVENIVGKKEKMLVTSIFSVFPQCFQKAFSPRRHQESSMCGNGLVLQCTIKYTIFYLCEKVIKMSSTPQKERQITCFFQPVIYQCPRKTIFLIFLLSSNGNSALWLTYTASFFFTLHLSTKF